MITYEDNCVGCTSMGLHCRLGACPNYYQQMVISCDDCGRDNEPIYQDGKQQLCAYCLANKHKNVFIERFFDEIIETYADEFATENFIEVMNNDIVTNNIK